MYRYLIEVPHAEEELACLRVVQTFLETGSHYLTNADWGCKDGDHRAWIIIEAESHEQAKGVVPSPLRAQANVIQINKFGADEIDEMLRAHSG